MNNFCSLFCGGNTEKSVNLIINDFKILQNQVDFNNVELKINASFEFNGHCYSQSDCLFLQQKSLNPPSKTIDSFKIQKQRQLCFPIQNMNQKFEGNQEITASLQEGHYDLFYIRPQPNNNIYNVLSISLFSIKIIINDFSELNSSQSIIGIQPPKQATQNNIPFNNNQNITTSELYHSQDTLGNFMNAIYKNQRIEQNQVNLKESQMSNKVMNKTNINQRTIIVNLEERNGDIVQSKQLSI